jgi:hypothetical protein
MNKNYIYIGVGVLAIGGLAWYFMRGKSMDSQKSAMGSSSSTTTSQDGSTTSTSTETATTTPSEPVFTSAGDTRKGVRRECRSYAKQVCGRGLGGGKKKCRKEKRKQCKSEGGYESSSESEDFAFNGLIF